MVRHIPILFDEQNLPKVVKFIFLGNNVVGTSERASVNEDSMHAMECFLVFRKNRKVMALM